MFSALRALFHRRFPADTLYLAVVTKARQPDWFTRGAVPDTIDGRFDMVALVFALVHRALERDAASSAFLVSLTERFVDDMDESLRELGIGDMVIGKHVGRLMGALGGRLGAYRTALDTGEGLADVLTRNLYRGKVPTDATLDWMVSAVTKLASDLDMMTAVDLRSGRLP